MHVTGAKFRKMREEMGFSQVLIARWFGVTEQTLRRWEQGKFAVPGPAQILVTLLYRETVLGEKRVMLTWLQSHGINPRKG